MFSARRLLMQERIFLITFVKFCIKSKMLIKGKIYMLKIILINISSKNRICEEQSYEMLIEIINEVREALEEFD